MTSTALTTTCPACKQRAAHEHRQYADASARKPAAEYILCRACGFDSRSATNNGDKQ